MYKSIQACRAAAALLVVLFHLGGTIPLDKYFGERLQFVGRPFSFGDAGVEFFFVLSGFIIIWVHARDIGRPARFLPYLRKRVTRIYPSYWLSFSAVALLASLSSSLRGAIPHDPTVLLKALLLIPQDPEVVGSLGAPVIIVAWSLQYEIVFYALVGLAILSRSLAWVALAALALNFFGCRTGDCSFPYRFLSSELMLLFLFGCCTAWVGRSAVPMHRPLLIATLAGLAFLALGFGEAAMGLQATWFAAEQPLLGRRMAYGLLCSFLILGLVRAEDQGSFRKLHPGVSSLGDASYALYLIHFPLISALCKLVTGLGASGVLWGCIAYVLILFACIAASLGFQMTIEKPLLNRLAQRHKSAAPHRDAGR